MKEDKEEELLDLTQQIVVALETHDLVMNQEEKDVIEGFNDSMLFFMEQRDYYRAIQEGRGLLNKLEQI